MDNNMDINHISDADAAEETSSDVTEEDMTDVPGGDDLAEKTVTDAQDIAPSDEEDEAETEEGEEEEDGDDDTVPFTTLLFDIVETLSVATCVIVLIFCSLFRIAVVSGPSMNKTLTNKDVLIVSGLNFEPKYGDIVVFQKLSSSLGDEAIVKRVIATEGQTIDIDFDTWTVTVDGVVIDESEYLYLASDQIVTSDYDFPITLKEGELFVMGDNRNHSADSRSMRIGIVDKRTVFGRVIMRVSPLTEFRIFGRLS